MPVRTPQLRTDRCKALGGEGLAKLRTGQRTERLACGGSERGEAGVALGTLDST